MRKQKERRASLETARLSRRLKLAASTPQTAKETQEGSTVFLCNQTSHNLSVSIESTSFFFSQLFFSRRVSGDTYYTNTEAAVERRNEFLVLFFFFLCRQEALDWKSWRKLILSASSSSLLDTLLCHRKTWKDFFLEVVSGVSCSLCPSSQCFRFIQWTCSFRHSKWKRKLEVGWFIRRVVLIV